jgi:hypothetical protein
MEEDDGLLLSLLLSLLLVVVLLLLYHLCGLAVFVVRWLYSCAVSFPEEP